MPVGKSIERFRGYPESYPPITVAEIPRPLWQQALIDWDDEDPPPLPRHFDDDVTPPTPSRRWLLTTITAMLFGALVLGTSLAWLWALPWTVWNEIADAQRKRAGGASGSQIGEADLGSRIDIAVASLPENPNASEEKRALIRFVRPELRPVSSNEPSPPRAPAGVVSKPEGALSQR
ncbi:hypothetical protein I6F35_13265 [Bradyrhizobium sp. BRP22]|uniref:hypothetical protein n=1 Tax=Bradyrhizobium sp. BRP22 TaxID=2793821 RepID=UPI001CD448CD|nr:hypothetical protein [Bradyrhizobium sp. BRP22]MCA1454178.1 hypothetical protein [Bradyrhizobium sp. BRP22]